jgi:hypothetical protein
MKLSNAFLAAAAVMALPVAANAAPLVSNGGFETGFVQNTEFGSAYSSGAGPTGWSGAGYALYYNGSSATTLSAAGQYSGSTTGIGSEMLWSSGGIFATAGNHFVALDGDSGIAGVQASIWQTIGGLTVGDTYSVAFNWGAAQLQSRTGGTTDTLKVTFGGSTLTTSTLTDASKGFVDGGPVTMSFVASATSQVLTFLSVGTPTGLPPIALLDNVSVTNTTVHATVPEPASLALVLTGMGMAGLVGRRRRSPKSNAA